MLGSINDKILLNKQLLFKPDTIFHSLLTKHVSLVEQNIIEGIKNNVFGTINIVESSISNKVSNFVFISTDKAVRPKNIMGATKRLADYIQALNKINDKNINLTIVRFEMYWIFWFCYSNI